MAAENYDLKILQCDSFADIDDKKLNDLGLFLDEHGTIACSNDLE